MSVERKNIIQIAEDFKKMEVKYDLFNKVTKDGIHYWNVVRYAVYMTVLSQSGIYENVGIMLEKKREPLWKRLAKAVRMIPAYLINEFRFQFVLPRNKKYCILLVSRFEDQQGNPTDLLLKDIYNQLKDEAFVMEYFRHRAFGWTKHNIGPRYFIYPLELRYLLEPVKHDDWKEISELVNREFNLRVEWKATFDGRMEEFRKSYAFFTRLFKKIKPQYLVFQSDPKGMIAAANDLGIQTLDLQHGHTNNVDMFYSYPKDADLSRVNSIPTTYLTQGQFWNKILDFPNNKITCGSSYFFIEHENHIETRNGVMAVSTMFIHDFLSAEIAALAQHHPDIIFYYKLHSNQAFQIRDTKAFFEPYPNVRVVYTERNVKDIMKDCFAVIVIQSSVAYQALQMGLQVFVFKKDYYEASYDIFDEKAVTLVEHWNELSEKLPALKKAMPQSNSLFFQPYDPSVIDSISKKSARFN